MHLLQFRIDGLTRSRLRRWTDLVKGTTGAARAFILPAVLVTAIYSVNHPGRIEITVPASGIIPGEAIIVAGRVSNPRIRDLALVANGIPQDVTAENSEFASRVDLRNGTAIVQALANGVGRNFVVRSNVIVFGPEKCGDGIDNDWDRQIDEECNFLLYVGDNECPDDTIAVYLDGQHLGDTPPGSGRHFSVADFSSGMHEATVLAKANEPEKYGCEANNVVTFEFRFPGFPTRIDRIEVGTKRSYSVQIP